MILIGDSKKCIGEGKSYSKVLSISECQEMTDLLCLEFGLDKVVCVQGRNTLRRHGSFNSFYRRITINKPSEGLILHELAHDFSMPHYERFKKAQEKLYKAWYGEREEI